MVDTLAPVFDPTELVVDQRERIGVKCSFSRARRGLCQRSEQQVRVFGSRYRTPLSDDAVLFSTGTKTGR